MKKLLYIFLFAVLILSGCEKKQELLAPASLFVMDGEATAAGVCPGDGPEEFKAAYRDYTLQVAWNDAESNFMVMSPDQIPYDEEISTMIATLFIDAKPVDPEAFCKEQNIQVEAYSPIAHGEALKNPAIAAMAQKYGVTAAQLCIRYVIQLGTVALPKTADPAHMKDNAAVDFVISDADMDALVHMDRIQSYGDFNVFPVFSGKPLA